MPQSQLQMLGFPQVSTFDIPAQTGYSSIPLIEFKLPEQQSQSPKMFVPRRDQLGGLVIYGHSPPTRDNSRSVFLLAFTGASPSLAKVTEGKILGAAITSWTSEDPIVATWSAQQISFRVPGSECNPAVIGCEGVTGASFRPGDERLAVRTETGINFLQVHRQSNSLAVHSTGRCESMCSGPVGTITYDASGKFLYLLEEGQCFYAEDNSADGTFKSLPLTDEEPFLLACPPDRNDRPRLAVVGKGEFASCTIGATGRWTKVRVAPPGAKVAANGISWLDKDSCVGWRRTEVFAFAPPKPTATALQPHKHRYSPPTKVGSQFVADPLRPQHFASWSPEVNIKVMSVQVIEVGGQLHIIVYTAPVPEDEKPKPTSA